MTIIEHAKNLLDFNQKLDIVLLDKVVNLMYTEHGDIVSFKTIKFFFLYLSKYLNLSKAKTSWRNFKPIKRTSRSVDSCRHHTRIFSESTNQILRTSNTGKNNKNQMESVAQQSA